MHNLNTTVKCEQLKGVFLHLTEQKKGCLDIFFYEHPIGQRSHALENKAYAFTHLISFMFGFQTVFPPDQGWEGVHPNVSHPNVSRHIVSRDLNFELSRPL